MNEVLTVYWCHGIGDTVLKLEKIEGDLSVFRDKCSYPKWPHGGLVDHHILISLFVSSDSSQIQRMMTPLRALLQRDAVL